MRSVQNLRQICKVQSWTNTIKRWNMQKARNSREEMDDKRNTEKYIVFLKKSDIIKQILY